MAARIGPNYATRTSAWKKQPLEDAPRVFEGKRRAKFDAVDIDKLYKMIGKLEMERDFLATRPGVAGHSTRGERRSTRTATSRSTSSAGSSAFPALPTTTKAAANHRRIWP